MYNHITPNNQWIWWLDESPLYGEKHEKTPGEMAEECKDLVQSTVDGHNVTIFACGDMRKLAQLVGRLVGWSWEWDRWIYFWWLGGDQKWEDDLGVSGTETEATNVQNQAGDIDEQVVFTGATPTFQPDLSPWWDTSALARCRTVHSTDAMTCCVTPRYGQTGAGKTYTLHGTPQEALWSCRCQWVYPLGCWDVQEESFYKL